MQDATLQILQTALTIIGIIVGAFVAIVLAVWRYMWWRNRKLNAYYDVMWKKSSKLKPKDLLPWRGTKEHGFHNFYHLRQEDRQIEQRLARGDHVLVIGNPLAGKTRAIYQALISSKKKYDVLIPKLLDVYNPLDIHIPSQFTRWRKRVLVLDDINKFAAKQGFTSFLGEFIKKNVIILATCRTGNEYEMLCRSVERELEWFGKPVEISKLSEEEKQQVEQQLGKALPERFDGNIGSIFVDIETMRQRFRACTTEEKGILRSLKRLHAAGIYKGRELFSLERLKLACDKLEGIQNEKYEWRALIDSLTKNGFVGKVSERPAFMEKVEEQIQTEETYLEQVIEDDFSPLDNLRQMLAIFAKDPDAAFDIGNESYNRGLVDIQKAAFMKVAVEAYGKTLEVWTYDNNPEKYAMTQNNLGISYGNLAELEKTAENCRAAITAFQEALSVRSLDRFPIQYANTQRSLGNAYALLPEARDKVANCRLAISAYREALKVHSLDRFPFDYAMTQNGLGIAYQMLAEVENKADNCQQAIAAYHQVLKVYNLSDFAKEYAMTQNNIGNAYQTVSDTEKEAVKKAANYNLAIEAYHKTLKVYSLDHFPIDYAMTQTNLGVAYRRLAEGEEKAKNCKLAIKAFQEALKIRTLDRFPMLYAKTKTNLGNAYGTLAEVEDRAENCTKAKRAFEEVLKVYTKEKLPEDYAIAMHNLEILYRFCEDVF